MKLRNCIVKILAWVLCIIVVLDFLWCFAVPKLLNKYFSNESIINFFSEKNIQADMTPINYNTASDFTLSVQVKNVNVQQDNLKVLNSNNLNLKIRILPLIFNKFSVDNFSVDNLQVNVIRNVNGDINIVDILPDELFVKILSGIDSVKLNINSYKIKINDKLTNTNISLDGDYIVLNNFKKNKKTDVNIVGRLSSNNVQSKFLLDLNTKLPLKKGLKSQDFNINLFVENLGLSAFSSLVEFMPHSEIEKLNGVITANIKTEQNLNKKQIVGKIITNNIEILEKLEENSSYLKEKANIDFIVNLFSQHIEVEKLSLKTLYHNINLMGKVENFLSNKPYLNLKLDFKNNSKSMIYNAIPSEIRFENALISKIKKYKPKANCLGSLEIKGTTDKPTFFGQIEVKDLFVDLPIARDSNIELKLLFNKDKVNILADIYTAKQESVNIAGDVGLYNKQNVALNVATSKNIRLDVVRTILIPVQDIFSINLGVLNQILLEKGCGSANLRVEGTKQEPKINGLLEFRDVTASLEGINAKLEKINGFIDFKGKNLGLAIKNALLNGDIVKLDGTSDFEGNYSVNIFSDKIKTSQIVNVIKTSPALSFVNKNTEELSYIKAVKGDAKINFNILGQYDINNNDFNIEKAKYNSLLQLKNNTLFLHNILTPISFKTANIKYDNDGINLVSNIDILNSQLNVDAQIVLDKINLYVNSQKFFLKDILKLANKKEFYSKFLMDNKLDNSVAVKFNANYSGPRKELDFKKMKLEASLLSPVNYDKKQQISDAKGSIKALNGDVFVDDLYLKFWDSVITANGKISDFAAKKPNYNIIFEFKNFNLDVLNDFDFCKFLNRDLAKIISAYENYKGIINGNFKIEKNGINGKLITSDIYLRHKKIQMPISITGTEFVFKNGVLNIPALHSVIDDVPVYVTAVISDILKKPRLKGYLTSNIYPNFINKYINANLGYPIKLKGEVIFKASFEGFCDEMRTNGVIKIPLGSDVSYMGANLKEEDFERELNVDLFITNDNIQILNETYSKYISSLNGVKTKYPYITVTGNIKREKIPYFENLRIKTFAPTNSEIFNILFKKSIIKSGNFECDLSINGNLEKLKVLGFAIFKDINMPLYETFVKDIYADFKKDNLEIKTSAKILNTNISAMTVIENKFNKPYRIKNAEINADYLNLDKVFDFLSSITMKTPISPKLDLNVGSGLVVNPADIVINDAKILAKEILIKEYPATDLILQLHQNIDGILKIDDLDFRIANGTINANGFYDFNTGELYGNCIAKSIDANQFSDLFMNVKNQIYGNLDGTVNISTKGSNTQERIKNVTGKILFRIKDGKMPKLGSLEYLLRAGNVVKNGITGFTINSIIELLVPMNTGEFSSINGDILFEDGKAQDIKIYSKGKNLSLYVTGSSDILENNTEMTVYGKLSKKVSTLLGPIGNTSLNTLFNLLPGVKISDKEKEVLNEANKILGADSSVDDFRFFKAIISGNLNSENYVQSFSWLE